MNPQRRDQTRTFAPGAVARLQVPHLVPPPASPVIAIPVGWIVFCCLLVIAGSCGILVSRLPALLSSPAEAAVEIAPRAANERIQRVPVQVIEAIDNREEPTPRPPDESAAPAKATERSAVPSDMTAIRLDLQVYPKRAAVRIRPSKRTGLELSVHASGYKAESRLIRADEAGPISLRLAKAHRSASKRARPSEPESATDEEIYLSGSEL
jgi:hypothetical protein